MKMIGYVFSFGLIAFSSSLLAESTQTTPQTTPQSPTQNAAILELSQKGCQKPIGFFPTPAKIMCILNSLGISEKEVKSKALALVFNVCKGRTLTSPPTGVTAKAYDTLGNCLSDPNAVMLINRELKAQGFTEVKVVNPNILKQATAQSS